MMKDTRFPTNVLNLLGLPDNHPKTTVLSVHAKTELMGMSSIPFTRESNRART